MINWFPIPEALVDSEDFRTLTPAERVHFLWLMSEFNRRDSFYKADLEAAITLGLSESKVRKARRRFQALGWIQTVPGFQSKRGNVATRYTAVKWAKVGEAEGFYAQMHRYAFEVMLDLVRCRQISHSQALLYSLLAYLRCRYDQERDGDFFVSKRDLRELTRLQHAPEQVSRLHASFTFHGGARLFDYREEYHRLKFTAWRGLADPSENARSQKIAQQQQDSIAQQYLAARQQPKSTARMDTADYFQKVVARKLGRLQAEEIRRLATKYGHARMEQLIAQWQTEAPWGAPREFFPWCRKRGVS